MPSIVLEQIMPSKLGTAVNVAFKGDEKLKDYHIYPSDTSNAFLNMAAHTTRRIITESLTGKARHYKVVLLNHPEAQRAKQIIGYTTIFLEPAMMLYSFGIDIRFRKKWILKRWMKLVDDLFEGHEYHAGLYEKNRRAISFLEKNGFKKTIYNAHDKSYFLCRCSEQ